MRQTSSDRGGDLSDDAPERAARLLGLPPAAADALRREHDPLWRNLSRLFGPLRLSRDARGRHARDRGRGGFTLVEVLIVVVVLGIMAAVVLPRFADSTGRAREEALRQGLRSLRQAVAVYRVRNADRLPGELGTEADLKADLAGLPPVFPDNPVAGSAAVKVVAAGGPASAQVGGGQGWLYDRTTGSVAANSAEPAGDGTSYCDW